MFKFKLSYVALAAALTSAGVYADPNAYTHQSGAKVIDIEAPNAAGVSHNKYQEFNVTNKGLILNNSGTDVNSEKFGDIAKNSHLMNGSASVILNEVISSKSSSLNGFIEVNGQKADVIVANPNGITCSGCSFINTSKAVLTTGNVNLSDTGAINSYTVSKGKITVDANGMNANESYVYLLADVIRLNDVVNAQDAMLSAGNFTYDNASGTITSAGKKATLLQTLFPEYSIDVSSLGGVKANNIIMVGNNHGFGVRSQGSILADNSITMTSNGNLALNNASGKVMNFETTGELVTKKYGMIRASETLNIKSHSLKHSADIVGGYPDINIDSYSINNVEGIIAGKNVNIMTYEDMVNADGSINAGSLNISIQNGGSLINRSIISGSETTITANKVINGGYSCGWFKMETCGRGTIMANNKLVLNTSHSDISELGGKMIINASEINLLQ